MKSNMALSSQIKRLVLIGIVAILLLCGVVLIMFNNSIFMGIFNSQLVLSPTSSSFPMWQDLPAPMLSSMYLFSVLNPHDVSAGAKPQLEQVGPYVFTEEHHKSSLVWNDNGTVTYRQIRTWHFLPELSNGTLDDQVTILNSVAASLGPTIQQRVPSFWIPGLNIFLKGVKETLFVTKSVREIIFDGYEDPILDDIEGLEKFLPFIKTMIPPGSITDKFAFFYDRNGTDYVDGIFNMYTGAGDVTRMGEVAMWNYTSHIYFPGKCGRVHGSAGEFYPPGLKRDFIDMFSNDLCRSIRLNFRREMKVKGINSYEYVADHSFFANGSENSLNSCYQPASKPLLSGVYNSSLCRFGAPIFMSQPHFFQADPYYGSLVDGLEPEEELHGTFFRVEPETGIPTSVIARFQLNLLLAPVKGISMLEHVRTTFFPVMWFENKAGVPDRLVFKMNLLASLPEILSGVGWANIGLASAIVIIASLYYISRSSKEEDTSPILNQSLVEECGDENVFIQTDED